jgi:predicted cupin superfamily sugar epimerase
VSDAAAPRSVEARALVGELGLEPHPEGGWFRRMWTAPDASVGSRGSGSSIHYLLEGGATSRWHRIDASELWQHAAGAPVVLSRWAGGPEVRRDTLGPAVPEGDRAQVVVEPGEWQSAASTGDWSLVVCVVVPEFVEDGFELAPEGWTPPGPQGDDRVG